MQTQEGLEKIVAAMLVVERPDRGGTLPDRVVPLLRKNADTKVVRGAGIKAALRAADRNHRPVYFVDNLRAAAYAATRFPRMRYVLDLGDAVGALLWTQGRRLAGVTGTALEILAIRRARGVVLRGEGHAGLLRALGARRVVLIPDLAAVPVTAFEQRDLGEPLVLGFVGSSTVTPKAQPAGWEIPRVLAALGQDSRACMIMAGSGVNAIRAAARDLGVWDRIDLHEGVLPSRIPRVFANVDIAVSSQTFNIVGEVRTTGKLVDYLTMGKVTVASRVGMAAALLPPECTVGPVESLFSEEYVRRLAERIGELSTMPTTRWHGLQRHLYQLASAQFSSAALSRVWLDAMNEWGMLRW